MRHAWRSKSGSPAEAGAFQSVAVSHGAMEQQGPAQVREPAEAPVEEARLVPGAQMTVEDAGCTGRAPTDVMQQEPADVLLPEQQTGRQQQRTRQGLPV